MVEGDVVLIESKEQEFRRGDVIVSKMNEILIVDVHSFEKHILRSIAHIKEDGTLFNSSYSSWNEYHTWRLASEEEKQKLFDKMKEQGLRWNAEEKRVEEIVWRAKDGKEYFSIDNQGNILTCEEDECYFDDNLHEFGNYFHTSEQAEEAAKRMKEVLRKYHEEIGE